MNNFTRQYLATALWASIDDDGEPLDDDHGIDDFAPVAIARAESDCAQFVALAGDVITGREDRAAHDLWLTRNHHGAGFWDGDWPEPIATLLTDAAHAMGELDAYVGDDGGIYFQ